MIGRRMARGRNTFDARRAFQIVEEFADCYKAPIRAVEYDVRRGLMDGKRHVWEAEMKEQLRTRRHPTHASRPPSRSSS